MIRFSGHYYDGHSSRQYEVLLHLDTKLVLHVKGIDPTRSYPLSEIEISPRLGDTVRSLAFADGSKCETTDNANVDEVEEWQGKGQSRRFVHRLESKWPYALIAMVVLIASLIAGYNWGIPVLAKKAAELIPDEVAYKIGQETLEYLDIFLNPSELDESRRASIEEGFAGMAKNYPSLPLNLVFRSGMGPNAFALPDGTVLVTDELVELAENDLQVLAVLAHEIGHVHHRHILRTGLEGSALALIISTVIGDVASISLLSSGLPMMYLSAHYSREIEWEADTFALEYLQANDIETAHFADILELMQGDRGRASGMFSYSSSHPPTQDRIERFR